jgi:hypothetical protein
MTADLVERLQVALDEAEYLARQATAGPWWSEDSDDCWKLQGVAFVAPADELIPEQVVNKQILKAPKRGTPYAEYWPNAADAEHIVTWDPARVLRLVERDRALLLEYEALKSLIEEENRGREDGIVSWLANTGDARDGWLRAGRLLALQHGVERAAEFWLGPST